MTSQAIGIGGHGSVFAAVHRKTGRQLACKVVDLRDHENEDGLDCNSSSPPNEGPSGRQQRWTLKVNKLVKECQVLKDLDHPNVVRLEKAFWTSNTIYIFQELLPGGDLFSYIESKAGPLEEAEASIIVLQIVKALDFLHSRDIVHRDLKPDNILLSSNAPNARVVLSDFGHARQLPKTKFQASERPAKRRRMTSIVGTFEYCAP